MPPDEPLLPEEIEELKAWLNDKEEEEPVEHPYKMKSGVDRRDDLN